MKLIRWLFRKEFDRVYMKGIQDGKDSLSTALVLQHKGVINTITVYEDMGKTYKLGVIDA